MTDISDFASRLRALMDSYNLSMNQLAKEIDTPVGSLAGYINDGREPKLSFFGKILTRFTNINSDWLILGKGEMIKAQEYEFMEKELNQVREKLILYEKLEKERELNAKLIQEAGRYAIQKN
jgi:transcriptional regulator with XRE-family HTH domain